jgi:hypothetical protein
VCRSFFGDRAPVDYIGGIMNTVPWVIQTNDMKEQLGVCSELLSENVTSH